MWPESYSYDERNNITSKTNGCGVTDYTYNAENRLVKAGNRTFEHDANGNMTKEILGNVTTDYSYTPLNRVTGITSSYPCFLSPDPKNRTTMVQYEYDAFGRRNSRTAYKGHEKHGEMEMKIETQTNHLYQGLGFNVLAEFENKKDNDRYRYDSKNNPTIEYLYAKGTVFSRNMFTEGKYRGNYWGMKEKDTAYYHQDPLGSTIMITDKKGHVEGRFSYDAFGSLYDDQTLPWGNDNWEQGGKHSAPLPLYNGKRLDPVVGLYDYGFRDYSPQQMRFTTVDPIKSGPNWYAYVNNDPVNFIDPLGLTPSDVKAARDLAAWEKAQEPTIQEKLDQLGTFGNPYEINAPIISDVGSLPSYVEKIFRDVSMVNAFNAAMSMSETGSGGGTIVPVGAALGTGAAFIGTVELTTYRRKGAVNISNYTIETMQSTGEADLATGWEKYALKEESRQNVAEHLLLNNSKLMERAITESEPSSWDIVKETIFNALGF